MKKNNSSRDDEDMRRAYWTEQMEAAYGFMGQMMAYPVEECGESLVSLPEMVKAEGVSVEFSRTRIAGCHDRIFYLRKGLISNFVAAARQMNTRGWILKVEDGFRSRKMQTDIALYNNVLDVVLQKVMWEARGKIPAPELLFRRLTCMVATCPKIGTHMSGSALDISVLSSKDFSEVDRGGPYIEISELTPMASPFISDAAARNRAEISAIMRSHGFMGYPYEFWHYSSGDPYAEYLTGSGKSGRYGAVDFDLANGSVTPILNAGKSLHSMEDIKRHIALALGLIKASGAKYSGVNRARANKGNKAKSNA
ncbi:MAG: M15 family metallopeptidase [Kiritimatiellae bacterium]|nr:M15 family metallopeptidase [Kiritimatiellia bacterium]